MTHHVDRHLVKAPQQRTTNPDLKLDGISTTKEEYKAWAIPPVFKRHIPGYMPNPNALEGTSTYSGAFVPKVAPVYHHPTPLYVPNAAKFEGQSTNKVDFMAPGKQTRREDYAPRNTYAPVKDDREFVSTTRGSHTPKPLPKCAAADWIAKPHEVHRDGHMFLSNAVDH